MPSKKDQADRLLQKYRAKRNFAITEEPSGSEAPAQQTKELSFCVQKHDATRLHYDFRLELDGVLKSWAVAKGPSFVPKERRLAVEVEDHPLAYGGFEGIIPQGQYGGGTVMLWDRGTWTPLEEPHEALKKGAIKFELHGKKLQGRWTLVRMAPRPKDRSPNWLLIKEKDSFARPNGPSLPDNDDESVLTGRTMDEIAAGASKVWQSKVRNEPTGKKTSPKAKSSRRKMIGFVEPELATLAEEPPAGREWLHEMKFDGYRLLAHVTGGKVTLYTRRGLDWTDRFPEIRDALEVLAQDALVDGEAAVLNAEGISDFSALQAYLSGERDGTLVFLAFDLLYFDGEDFRTKPLLERKERLKEILEPLNKGGHVLYSDHVVGSGGTFFAEGCKRGLEGIISKRTQSEYSSGRSKDWLKVKCGRRQEFVIGGFVPPTTGQKGVGSLAVGFYESGKLVYAGRVGTGFTAAVSRRLRTLLDELARKTSPFAGGLAREATKNVIWVKPELVAEVAFAGWTADRMIRHASFKGLREDKAAEEVVLEQPVTAAARQPSSSGQRREIDVGGIRITHPDRVLDKETRLTKGELAEYYLAIADWILPHVVDRPLSFVRCPEGVRAQCFYQRHRSVGMPAELRTVQPIPESPHESYLSIEDIRGLLELVQFGVMEIHPWGATNAQIEKPDWMIFDLDPDPAVDWERVVEAAFLLRDRLKKERLQSFVKTTGGKGLHVVTPLDATQDWEAVKTFARNLAQALADEKPDEFTAVLSKQARSGKIFVDYLRNERSATAVAPYSTRARVGAPVATPLKWEELSANVDPHSFTIPVVRERLQGAKPQSKKDPWTGFFQVRQAIGLGKQR